MRLHGVSRRFRNVRYTERSVVLRQGQRAHIGRLGKLGKFAQCAAFGYILLSLDGWNRKEKQQEDKTDGRNDCESSVRCEAL